MQKRNKFEINALNVIKSILIIITLSIVSTNSTSHNKNKSNKIASVSTFNALEQMLFSVNIINNNNNNETHRNINYNTTKEETETKIKIKSKQHGRTKSNIKRKTNSNTNYTPVSKINEIIKNVQSADCPASEWSSMATKKEPTRISQSYNGDTEASWSSGACKRIDNSENSNYCVINIPKSDCKQNKKDIIRRKVVGRTRGSKLCRGLHRERVFNKDDLAHGKQPELQDLNLNLSLPFACGGKETAPINKRQQRTKRLAIFDGGGVVKFVIGVAIPVKLVNKQRSVHTVFNLQSQYTPPPVPLYWWSIYNTTTFPARSTNGESSQAQLSVDTSRTFIYTAIEKILESNGIPGTECLLKTICVMAQQPLAEGNLINELLNSIFIPVAENIRREYLDAKAAGRYGVDCARTFGKCPRNINLPNGLMLKTL